MSRVCNGAQTGCSSLLATEHYQLPQWAGETPTSWLTQMNEAMQKIDDLFHEMALRTAIDGLPDETVEEVVRLSNLVSKLRSDTDVLIDTVGGIQLNQSNMQEQIARLQTRMETLTNNFVNLDTRMTTLESRMDNMELRVDKIENTYVDKE